MDSLVQRAAGLTRQLLLFARRGFMQRRVLDLNSLLGELLKMIARLIGEHIRLTFRAGKTALWVNADPGMMEQVVTNLVLNARDAMPGGGQTDLSTQQVDVNAAHVAAHPEGRLGTFVCLTVSDTGRGMDELTIQRIFEPFFTTKEVGKGTGLGLSTVQGIVQQHQGWIEVESVVGQGSTLRVYLPAVELPRPEVTSEVSPEPLQGGSETVLVVEDETAVRQLTVQTLQRHGYRVLQASHGQEALRLWEEHGATVDLLLSDVVMPEGLGGIELAERLCKIRSELRVVLMSGYSAELMAQGMGEPAGAVFLQKPFAPAVLLRTIRQSLDGRHSR
jgi:CheY-like chemotaxis protein